MVNAFRVYEAKDVQNIIGIWWVVVADTFGYKKLKLNDLLVDKIDRKKIWLEEQDVQKKSDSKDVIDEGR